MDAGVTWYQARRARCQIRAITPTAEHGPDWPAQITAHVLAWDTP
jgi:hypothetical protein